MQNPSTPFIVGISAETFAELHDAIFTLAETLDDPGRISSLAVDEKNCRARIELGPTSSASPAEAERRHAEISELADALLKKRILH